jgi:putative transposase
VACDNPSSHEAGIFETRKHRVASGMVRPTRVDLAGAWYHVLNRVAEKRQVFRSRRCCEKFLEVLSDSPMRFGVRIHGYLLMGNHHHPQTQTREPNLNRAVH